MKEKGLELSKYITPGSRIELQAIERVRLSNGDYEKKVYGSKVYDIMDDDSLEVLMPIEQTKLILLPVEGEYDVHFFTTKGLFQCLARVKDRYKRGNLYLLEIELISDLKKYQRREYYRYSCVMESSIRELNEEESQSLDTNGELIPSDTPGIRCVIVDISGGGIRYIATREFKTGQEILCEFCLQSPAGMKRYSVIGRVLFCQEMENHRGQYEHRVQFIKIENSEREEIIRYIFEEERKNRKKN